MRLSQKRTCNNCYAIKHFICDFGHDIFDDKGKFGVPQQPCYKPITSSDYISVKRILSEGIITYNQTHNLTGGDF